MRSSLFLLLLLACALASCEDKISTLGAPYYRDTIQFKTVTISDTGFMKFSNVRDTFVTVAGQTKNLTLKSPMMIVGRVVSGSENVESWGVLQFPIESSADTISKIIGVRLLLKNIVYKYGDTNSTNLDLQVYASPPGGKIADSMTTLAKSDLSANRIDSLSVQNFADTANNTLAIPIDTSILQYVRQKSTSFGYVIVPGATMTNMRAFSTMESGNPPQIEYTLRISADSTAKIYRNSNLDLHLVHDQSTTPPNEFTIRGSSGQREKLTFNLTRPSDSLQLSQFSTINSAYLVLHLDRANSNFRVDTTGPWAVRVTPTGDTLDAIGVRDTNDVLTVRVQVRSVLEYWLHSPSQNFGLELRSGLAYRLFTGAYEAVEDYNVNRWTFFGPDYPDVTKRPSLILTYSRLP